MCKYSYLLILKIAVVCRNMITKKCPAEMEKHATQLRKIIIVHDIFQFSVISYFLKQGKITMFLEVVKSERELASLECRLQDISSIIKNNKI